MRRVATRKWWVTGLGLLLVGVGAALLWPSPTPEDPSQARRTQPAPLPDFKPVDVTDRTGQGLTLTGVVHGADGQPLAGAEVALASSLQPTLATVKCDVCGAALLACPSHNTWPRVGELLRSGRGHLHAATQTVTDAEGRFRFEGLRGVSFTVWATAAGHGSAAHERAAPGDPVSLYLPALRGLGGVVVDDVGAPVRGAQVHVLSRRLPVPVVAATGPDGIFEASGLGEGPFYVYVEAQGFLPHAEPLVDAGPTPVRLRLRRPRVLEVEVLRQGTKVDATVEVASDHLERVFTAQGGEGRLDGLFPAEVQVSAYAGDESSPVVRVGLEGPLTRVKLELGPAGRLAVTVVDEAGGPVVDPVVWLSRAADADPLTRRRARTGELVQFGPLAAGEYVLVGEAKGHRHVELPVKVPQGGEANVELVLPKGTFISGRVLDEYGRPAPGITVLVQPIGTTVQADDEGAFTADVPSPGLYDLHAHHSDWGGGDARVTAPAEGVELHLEPKAGLRVTVQSEGRRLEGAEVLLWLERQTTWRNDRPSGSDGVVLMRGMPPGSYQLVANHKDFIPSQPMPVTLEDGALLDLTVDLDPGAVIEGDVVDDTGAPVSGATVVAFPRGVQPVVTDAKGHFELRPVRAERVYRLDAHHPAYDQRERATTKAGGPKVTLVMKKRGQYRGRVLDERGAPLGTFKVDGHLVSSPDGRFELPLPSEEGRVFAVVEARGYQAHMIDQPAEQPDVGDISLQKEPELLGRVVDESMAPVEGAVVGCDVCDGTAMTDREGVFSLSVPPNLASFSVTATKGSRSGSTTGSSSQDGNLEVVLRQAVTVQGRVFRADGQPAAGVEVEAVHVDRGEPATAVTGQDGAYTLELAEGAYRFVLPGSQRPFGGEPIVFAQVSGGATRVDLGPAPGTSSVDVRITPAPGHALWIVRGQVSTVQTPPVELFKAGWAQMLYQPRSEVVTLSGVPPGRYTLVWARFHGAGGEPQFRSVDVPGTREVSFGP